MSLIKFAPAIYTVLEQGFASLTPGHQAKPMIATSGDLEYRLVSSDVKLASVSYDPQRMSFIMRCFWTPGSTGNSTGKERERVEVFAVRFDSASAVGYRLFAWAVRNATEATGKADAIAKGEWPAGQIKKPVTYPWGTIEQHDHNTFKLWGEGVPPFYSDKSYGDLESAKHFAVNVLGLNLSDGEFVSDLERLLVEARGTLANLAGIGIRMRNGLFVQLSSDTDNMLEVCDAGTGVPMYYIEKYEQRYYVGWFKHYSEMTGEQVTDTKEAIWFAEQREAVAFMAGMAYIYHLNACLCESSYVGPSEPDHD